MHAMHLGTGNVGAASPAVVAVQLVLALLQCVEAADVVQAELRAPHVHVQRRQRGQLRGMKCISSPLHAAVLASESPSVCMLYIMR